MSWSPHTKINTQLQHQQRQDDEEQRRQRRLQFHLSWYDTKILDWCDYLNHLSPRLQNQTNNNSSIMSTTEMDLAEALRLTPFASLAGNATNDGQPSNSNKPDKYGRSILCAPYLGSVGNNMPRAPPGIAFRARGSGNVVVIEAVRLSPPSTLLR
jgi:hypothetical protein